MAFADGTHCDAFKGMGRLTFFPGSILEEEYMGEFCRGVKHGRGVYVYRKSDGWVSIAGIGRICCLTTCIARICDIARRTPNTESCLIAEHCAGTERSNREPAAACVIALLEKGVRWYYRAPVEEECTFRSGRKMARNNT